MTFDNMIVVVLTVAALVGLFLLNRTSKKSAKTNNESQK